MDINKILHTSWNCKYHVIFAPKYKRKAFYGGRRLEIEAILMNLYNWKGINLLEAEVCSDHEHMLLTIPLKYSVLGIMGYLRKRNGGLKIHKYRKRDF